MSNTKEVKNQAIKDVVGKTWEEAQRIFTDKYPHFLLRCVWRDGQSFGGTKDLDTFRLNVGVKDGIVLDEYNHRTDETGCRFSSNARWY